MSVGGAPWGACPLGRWFALPPRYPTGGMPSLSPAYPAFSLLLCPHPPNPLPGGKGGIFSFLMQGAAPLASPGAGRGAALARRALAAPRGGLAFLVAGSPCCHGTLWGGLPSLPPANAAFSLLSRPHPPDPLPSGKGETKVLLCKGLRPLHPRGWAGRGTGSVSVGGAPWGACPLGRRFALPPRYPAGACLLCHLPTLPLACFSAPIPPTPFPAGRGRL